MRYYVDNSSWFDSHPYNKAQIKAAVKRGGGKNIRESHNYGWSNQPKVITFEATKSTVSTVEKAIQKALGTQWIIIRKKDW
ncbi:MAG: hypothetical protein DRJ64_08710 [Thermoprotei archaeon]|nr:MAG: hypothetical protein DRJ64_08710 [Thermoprotei archaeon]